MAWVPGLALVSRSALATSTIELTRPGQLASVNDAQVTKLPMQTSRNEAPWHHQLRAQHGITSHASKLASPRLRTVLRAICHASSCPAGISVGLDHAVGRPCPLVVAGQAV